MEAVIVRRRRGDLPGSAAAGLTLRLQIWWVQEGAEVIRFFIGELGTVGVVTALGLTLFPRHPVLVMVTIVVTWVVFQLICVYAFMAALYRGDIVEYRTKPRSYAIAPRASINWRARRFLMSYLQVAPSRASAMPGAVEAKR